MDTPDTRPVFGYVRVSTDRQEVTRQETELPQLHSRLPDGLAENPLRLFYEKHGTSAYTGKPRPGLEDLLAEVNAGNASALLIDTSSRLTRQGIEAAVGIFINLKSQGTRLFTTTGGEYPFDLSGWIRLIIDAERDQNYSRDLSHNITSAKAAQRKTGRYPHGQLTPGYKRTPGGQVEPTDDLPVIAELFRLFLAGRTFKQLSDYANAQLSADVLGKLKNGADHHAIRRWLRSPLYIGLLPHKRGKETHASDHQPAVTVEVWDAAQAKLDHNRAANAARAPRAWPFAGIAKCGFCHGALRTHRVQHRTYLRCHDRSCGRNSKSPISSVFEANVIVGLVAIAYAIRQQLTADSAFAIPTGDKTETLDAARERLASAKTELQRVEDLIIANGGTADDPRLIHLRDQRDAAAEDVAQLSRAGTDYRDELHRLADSVFGLRFHVPAWLQADLARDWAMQASFTPLFPDEMAEAVLLGWQYAPFEDRLNLVREALSAVVYHGETIEWRFRSALPEPILTGAALMAERTPLVNALDAEGWGRTTCGVSVCELGPAQALGRGGARR